MNPDPAPHSPTVRDYARITLALLTLLVLTVAVAYMNLGVWSTAAAMLIAVIKAVLIILFFMHLKAAAPLNRVVLIAGFFWLAIMLTLAMSDFLSRG